MGNLKKFEDFCPDILQGLVFWVAYKKQYFRSYHFSEGALTSELYTLISAFKPDHFQIIAECHYSRMSPYIKNEELGRKKSVDILFRIYSIVYGGFDKVIHILDPNAYKVKTFPNWFMTLVSIYGLGFQLLIIALMLAMNWIQFILPFFIYYTAFIAVLIGIRKTFFGGVKQR